MPTVYQQEGFAFRIFPADHEPPHVHVWKAGAKLKVGLGSGSRGLYLMSNQGMSPREARRAVIIAEANQQELLAAWKRYHA
ncbi:MAG: DUF4160 domain-containing protein [Gemmatimonadetes bacterium]|nr:DUF4160 domain-containing protein [Gemmatimonadota bacterium]